MELAFQHLSAFLAQVGDFLAFDTARLAEGDMVFRLSIQGCLLIGSAFFSGSETALFSLSDVDLEQLRKQRHSRSDLLHALLSQPRRLIISILCGNELINIAATANMTGVLVALYGGDRAGVVSVIVMVPLLLLFGEITPKTIAVSHPIQVSTRLICMPLNVWVRLSVPIRWAIRLVADKVTTWIVGEERDVDHLLRMSEFRSLVAEIEEEGLVTATDRVLIYNLLEAGNTEIVHIMTPRTQTQFVRLDMKLSEAMDLFIQYQRLRMPVYEGSRDNIMGFIHVEDVMELILDGKQPSDFTCQDTLRKPLFVPLTKSVDEMLDFFHSHDASAAMVLNEFGGVSGIVTMEDVLNFVFGEIAGEFLGKYTYEQEDERVFVVSGDMKLSDFEALTNFGIQDPRMTTIAGVAFRHLGRVPKEGDTITLEDIRITVLEMKGNRIARLRASKIDEPEEE
jgi:CBS domain containing-hemolysin-like protein